MIDALALDLEYTLIYNVDRPIPRPYLYEFLDFCFSNIPHVVLFTGIRNHVAMEVLYNLGRRRHIPIEASNMHVIRWNRVIRGEWQKKDLKYVQQVHLGARLDHIYLVDDIEEFVLPSQRNQWIRIDPFRIQGDDVLKNTDNELVRIQHILEEKLKKSIFD